MISQVTILVVITRISDFFFSQMIRLLVDSYILKNSILIPTGSITTFMALIALYLIKFKKQNLNFSG